jgi:6-pyruvoyltetrahydropterin/6-carboxytetrahydropterin synthase
MFEISIKTQFSAAHHLEGYRGACEAVHGHNWEVEVFVAGEDLDETGILVDFRVARQAVQSELEALDHTDLNEHPAFAVGNPTSENIARFLYVQLSQRLAGQSYRVSRVSINETPGSRASYWE